MRLQAFIPTTAPAVGSASHSLSASRPRSCQPSTWPAASPSHTENDARCTSANMSRLMVTAGMSRKLKRESGAMHLACLCIYSGAAPATVSELRPARVAGSTSSHCAFAWEGVVPEDVKSLTTSPETGLKHELRLLAVGRGLRAQGAVHAPVVLFMPLSFCSRRHIYLCRAGPCGWGISK